MPFIHHPLAVALAVREYPDFVVAAVVLHDVIKDTNLTQRTLFDLGVDPRTRYIVDVLTRREGENYFDYIHRITVDASSNTIAVKMADIWHNLTRPDGTASMNTRYTKASKILLDKGDQP